MDAAGLDKEARLRAEIRAVISDLRSYGIPDSRLRDKCLAELWDMRDLELRRMMGAPKAAA